MTLDFQTTYLTLPVTDGIPIVGDTVIFPSRVRRASLAINGFKVDYEGDEDHHFGHMDISTNIQRISGRNVTISVSVRFSDKYIDDTFSGYVTLVVFADLY